MMILFENDESYPLKSTEQSHSRFGFSSASGKKIGISNQALEQARKLFEVDEITSADSKPPNAKISETFAGFSSAGGKKIEISSEALKQAKRLFESDDLSRNETGFAGAGENKFEITCDSAKVKASSSTKRKLPETKNNYDSKRTKSEDHFGEEDEVYKNIVLQMDTQMLDVMECFQDSEGFSDENENVSAKSDDECLSPILTNPFCIEDDLTAGN